MIFQKLGVKQPVVKCKLLIPRPKGSKLVVETDEEENEDGEDKKVLAIIGQDNWNLKKKRRYIKDKDGLVDILCF